MEPQNQKPRSPDGRWEWDGQQWQPVPQGPPPPRQPYKFGKGAWAVIVTVVGFVALMVIGMIASAANGPAPSSSPKPVSATTSTPTSAPPPTARPTPRPTQPPTPRPEPVALFDVNGQNSGETTAFDGPSHYKVTYSFDCSNSYGGGSGNFILSPVDSNGNSVAGPLVNRLAASGNGTADGYNLGTKKAMRLQVISTCSWSVKGMTT